MNKGTHFNGQAIIYFTKASITFEGLPVEVKAPMS